VNVEFADVCSDQMKRIWLELDCTDDEKRSVFVRLDNEAIFNTALSLGRELAVSFRNFLDLSFPRCADADGETAQWIV
jgi:hypothetical protein